MSDSLQLKLGADTSEFRGQLASASKDGASAIDQLGANLEHRLSGRHLATSIATAVGLNIEKIAEGVASVVFGITDEAKKALVEMGEITDRIVATTADQIKARQGLSQRETADERKLQSLTREQNSLIQERGKYLAANYLIQQLSTNAIARTATGPLVAHNSAKVDELTKQLAANALAQQQAGGSGDEAKRKTQEQATALSDRQFQTSLKALTVQQQIDALEERSMDLARQKATFKGAGVDMDNLSKRLQETELQLTEKQIDLHKQGDEEALKMGEDALNYEKANKEELLLQAKALHDGLNEEESKRLETLQIQSKQLQIQGDIDTLLLVPVTKLSQQEKEMLDTLTKQNAQLEKKKAIINTPSPKPATPTKEGDIGDFRGDNGAAKIAGGIEEFFNAHDQALHEQQVLASAGKQTQDAMNNLDQQISRIRSSGDTAGQYALPALQRKLDALRGRSQNLRDYAFNPNYADAAGQGIFAEQVSTIGDPLGLQKISTDRLGDIQSTLGNIDKRLQMAGFETSGLRRGF